MFTESHSKHQTFFYIFEYIRVHTLCIQMFVWKRSKGKQVVDPVSLPCNILYWLLCTRRDVCPHCLIVKSEVLQYMYGKRCQLMYVWRGYRGNYATEHLSFMARWVSR